MMSALHQYVPTKEYTEEYYIPSSQSVVQIPKALFHPIIIEVDVLELEGQRKPTSIQTRL
jgi:hypothetical protein